jgi:hypothetical protein
MTVTTGTYAGSALCGAVNALLHALDVEQTVPVVRDRAEGLRRAHNPVLFDEARTAELPDTRHEPLLDAAARLGHSVDALVKEYREAVDLLRGMVGLIQLTGHGEQNHRYVDAVAWLEARERS